MQQNDRQLTPQDKSPYFLQQLWDEIYTSRSENWMVGLYNLCIRI
jgi:hypothetical protein